MLYATWKDQIWIRKSTESKGAPVHASKPQRWSRTVSPLILNLGTTWRSMIYLRPGRFIPGQSPGICRTDQVVPQPVWKRRENSHAPSGIRTQTVEQTKWFHSRSGREEKTLMPLAGFEHRPSNRPSGPTAGLEEKKKLSCPQRDSNTDRPARSLVAIPPTLLRLTSIGGL